MPDRPVKILLVAPHWRSRRVIKDALGDGVPAVYTELDGIDEALALARSETPDLAIVAESGESDGIERLIRALTAPTVVFGKARAGSRRAAHWVAVGAFAYLTRPFQPADVRALARTAVGTRQETAATPAPAPALAGGSDWLEGLFERLRGHLARAQYLDRH